MTCPHCHGPVWRNHERIAACANAKCAWIERPSTKARWQQEDTERVVRTAKNGELFVRLIEGDDA